MCSEQKSKNDGCTWENITDAIFIWGFSALLLIILILAVIAPNANLPRIWEKSQLTPTNNQPIAKNQRISSITEEYEGEYSEDKSKIAKTTITTATPKTLWDLFSVAGVPLALVVLGFILQKIQSDRDEKAAQIQRDRDEEAAKEEILQTYFDRLSVLLIDRNLLTIAAKVYPPDSKSSSGATPDKEASTPLPEATPEEKQLLESSRDLIRARTLSVLRRFENDSKRKTIVIRFLDDAGILSGLRLDLSNADLRDTDLSGLNCKYIRLNHADLSNVTAESTNFEHAEIMAAKFNKAKLSDANFSYANLMGATLTNSTLTNAVLNNSILGILLTGKFVQSQEKLESTDKVMRSTDLSGADLSGADLSGAILLAVDLRCDDPNTRATLGQLKQLSGSVLLYNVNLPEGINFDLPEGIEKNSNINRDPLSKILYERYPNWFRNIEAARFYVDKARQKKWD